MGKFNKTFKMVSFVILLGGMADGVHGGILQNTPSPQTLSKEEPSIDPFLRTGKYLEDPISKQPLTSHGQGAPKSPLPANIANLPFKGTGEIEMEYCVQYLQEDIEIFNEVLEKEGINDEDLEKIHRQLGIKIYLPELRSVKGWATSGFMAVAECRMKVLGAQRVMRETIKEHARKGNASILPESIGSSSALSYSQQTIAEESQKMDSLKQELVKYENAIRQALNPKVLAILADLRREKNPVLQS